MKKPYISCPLEAALAAKNHGFKYINDRYNIKSGTYPMGSLLAEIACDLRDNRFKNWKLYIHFASLPLLEPMVGDIVINPDGMPAIVMISGLIGRQYASSHGVALWYAIECVGTCAHIIQRNGKPFPTISYEEEQQ